jgi:hypothetical protein
MNQTYFKKNSLEYRSCIFHNAFYRIKLWAKKNVKSKTTSNFVSDSLFNALKWRNIGPFRSEDHLR